jgi:uncharacterized protein
VTDAGDREGGGRARQGRPRDALGRPLPHGSEGVTPIPDIVRSPLDTIDLAQRLIHQGRAFSAHEVFESRWKHGPLEQRDLWQGLAQLCVALTHAGRGNHVGAARVLQRARDRLDRYLHSGGPTYGLDLTRAWERAQDCVATQRASPAARLPTNRASSADEDRWESEGGHGALDRHTGAALAVRSAVGEFRASGVGALE